MITVSQIEEIIRKHIGSCRVFHNRKRDEYDIRLIGDKNFGKSFVVSFGEIDPKNAKPNHFQDLDVFEFAVEHHKDVLLGEVIVE